MTKHLYDKDMNEVSIKISNIGTFKYFVKASATANTNEGTYASSLIWTELVEFELTVTESDENEEIVPLPPYVTTIEPFSVSIPDTASVESVIGLEENSCSPDKIEFTEVPYFVKVELVSAELADQNGSKLALTD